MFGIIQSLYLGVPDSLEVVIGGDGSLERAHLSFFCVLTSWFASIGIRARLIVFYSNHRSPITMSFQIFLSAEQHARLQKMRLDFLAWDEKFTKKMEENMRKIESFSLPHSSHARESPPLVTTPKSQHIKQCHKQNHCLNR